MNKGYKRIAIDIFFLIVALMPFQVFFRVIILMAAGTACGAYMLLQKHDENIRKDEREKLLASAENGSFVSIVRSRKKKVE